MFLLKEIQKTFASARGKKRVGFVLDVFPLPYNSVMASTRLRAYDVILAFSGHPDFFLELYRPGRRYDIVVFQKAFRRRHFLLAQKLKQQGVKTVLDLNTAFFITNTAVQPFIRSVDHFLVSSPYLLQEATRLFPEQNISLIEEHIPAAAFSVQKNTEPRPRVLAYAGYAPKATEVLHIQNVLEKLRKRFDFSLLFLCERNPRVNIPHVPSRYVRYRQSHIYEQLLEGDIFVAPRQFEDQKNYGHSFTKIGVPMAVGLPVVASPVPAYEGSPALLCEDGAAWYSALERLLTDPKLRRDVSSAGRAYCRSHYATRKIMDEYAALFRSL